MERNEERLGELVSLIKGHFPPESTDQLDILVARAQDDTASETRRRLAALMRDFLNNGPLNHTPGLRWNEDDLAKAEALLLSYTEKLAAEGDSRAARYAALWSGSPLSCAPDFAKACSLAEQAARAGDLIAAQILPYLRRERNGHRPPRPR